MKKYELTPEHREQLKPWANKWIKTAMSTKPYTNEEKEKLKDAVEGLYRAANLEPPPRERIVFVPSPFVLRFAGGYAAAIWHNKNKTKAATTAATRAATRAATEAATRAATQEATWAATEAATWDATEAATDAATETVTWAATASATRDATTAATDAATTAATRAATWGATWDTTWNATWDATEAATWNATGAVTRDAAEAETAAATWDATAAATAAATREATAAATATATTEATWNATWDATWNATWNATGAVTEAATWNATGAATWDAAEAETEAATEAATTEATRAATEAVTRDAAEAVTRDAAEAATRDAERWFLINMNAYIKVSFALGLDKFGLSCATSAYKMWDGGNQWVSHISFLSFFRHIAKLDIDYTKWKHYEFLATAGPRIMHEKFCMISERPVVLKVDDDNQPHCENGPFCQWSTGEALYAWHGTRIPAKWIEDKSSITPEIALKWDNIEQRRCAQEIWGLENILVHPDVNAKIINEDAPDIGTLYHANMQDVGEEAFLKVKCGTGRVFVMRVDTQYNTALEANASLGGWRKGMDTPPINFIPFIRS